MDVSGANGNRIISGVETDTSDKSSAANVGYVEETAAGLRYEMSSGFSGLYSDLEAVKSEIGEVAAGAAALAGLDYMPYEEGQKLSFAVGFGSYKSHQATALGMKYYFNKDAALNFATTLGYNENMISGGLSFRFGPGGSKRIASPEVTQKLAEMEGEISALKAQNAKLMEALDQLMKEHEAQENTQDAVM